MFDGRRREIKARMHGYLKAIKQTEYDVNLSPPVHGIILYWPDNLSRRFWTAAAAADDDDSGGGGGGDDGGEKE